jgi:dTDP-6-deoxy-L-talose 4-dehydrogenase (NAD+)
MMKVLVTGATGGVGSLIVEELLKQGIEVVATSRDIQKAKQCSFYSKVTYMPYDLGMPLDIDLFSYFGKPDALIHNAWEKLNEFKNEEHLTVYLKNHKDFVGNLIRNGLQDFNGIGTCYECGLHEGLLEEGCATAPTLPYSQAKDQLRLFVEEQCLAYQINFKWIRLFYVFGKVSGRKNLYTLLNEAIQKGDEIFNMSGGEQVRDFSSPAEYAQKIVKIATQKEVVGIINCCSGIPVKLKEFVNEYLIKNNHKIKLNLGFYPYPDYEPMQTWGSTEKLNKILNN